MDVLVCLLEFPVPSALGLLKVALVVLRSHVAIVVAYVHIPLRV